MILKCNKCLKEKEHTQFSINRQTRTGYDYKCKRCMSEKRKLIYERKKNGNFTPLWERRREIMEAKKKGGNYFKTERGGVSFEVYKRLKSRCENIDKEALTPLVHFMEESEKNKWVVDIDKVYVDLVGIFWVWFGDRVYYKGKIIDRYKPQEQLRIMFKAVSGLWEELKEKKFIENEFSDYVSEGSNVD